jgi:hypothetical protein
VVQLVQVPPSQVAGRARLSTWAGSTPGRLIAVTSVVVALGLLVGVVAVLGTVRRASLVDSIRLRSGPLTVSAQQLYRSLSDADATAAAAFLSGGVEPAALRDRYQSDVTAAGTALTQAAGASDSDQEAVRQIAAALPVYTGLVDTARAYNRMNLPLGAAYLREASNLMRERLLPAAERLYRSRTDRLATDRAAAAGLPWPTLALIVLGLAGLVLAQMYLTRRTNRLVNIGLAGSTLATLALLVWFVIAWAGAASALHASDRDGSARVQAASQARIAALQGRADEALTLVAHGNGAAFETDYTASMARLTDAIRRAEDHPGDTGPVDAALRDAMARASAWQAVHKNVRAADDGGRYADAVNLAVGTGDQTGASAAFNGLDGDLGKAIGGASATFDTDAARAGDALSGTGIGFGVLAALALAGAVIGLQRRIREYA